MIKKYRLLWVFSLCFIFLACGRQTTFSDVVLEPPTGPETPQVTPNSGTEISTDFSVGQTGGQADILFISDNSGSMAEEQKNMADRFSNMVATLSGIDWQIGVSTTETGGLFSDGGELSPFDTGVSILNSTMDLALVETLFAQTIQTGDDGTIFEKALTATKQMIDRIGDDPDVTNFFRADSHLALVIVSDEDESGGDTSAQELIQVVEDTFGVDKSFTAHSIITIPDDFDCLFSNGAEFGDNYAELSMLTGGIIGSICEDDYTKQLVDIGKNIASKSIPSVDLQCEPTNVLLDGEALEPTDYEVDGERLIIKKDLDVGDYTLTYTCA